MGMLGTLFGQNPFGGIANTASGYATTAQGQGTGLFGQAQSTLPGLNAYYSNMMKNPQGLGATTMDQLLTQAGQATAGATGGAARTAQDLAARTGNVSAIPAAIAGANKAGMTNLTNAALNLSTKNAMDKLQQQQTGAEGLAGLFGKELSGASSFEDLANKELGTELSADEQKQAAEQAGLKNLTSIASSAIGAIPGNPGGAGDIMSNILGGI
jgi:hypothetical protein